MKYSRSDADAPSRTQRKKASTALQELGEAIVALPRERVHALSLGEDLEDAVIEAQRITAHEGRRRQLQLVGRRMRELDEDEVSRIRAALESLERPSRDEVRRDKAADAWRERLLDDPAQVDVWAAAHEDADPDALRALVAQARAERTAARPPRAFRELFRFLRDAERDAPR